MTTIEYVNRVIYEVDSWLKVFDCNFSDYKESLYIDVRWVFRNPNKMQLMLLNTNPDKKEQIIIRLKQRKLHYKFKNNNNRIILTIKKHYSCVIL